MAVLPGGRPSGPAQAVGGRLAASGALGPEGQAAAAARRITPDMTPGEVRGELDQRRKRAAARSAAKRAAAQSPGPAGEPSSPAGPGTTGTVPAPPSSGAGPSLPGAFTDQAGSPGWWSTVSSPANSAQVAANAGGGFLLGLFAWALGLAYLRGGSAGVKQLLVAKFLNGGAAANAKGSFYLNGMTAEQMQNAVGVAQALQNHPEASAPGTVLGNLSNLNLTGLNNLATLNGGR